MNAYYLLSECQEMTAYLKDVVILLKKNEDTDNMPYLLALAKKMSSVTMLTAIIIKQLLNIKAGKAEV